MKCEQRGHKTDAGSSPFADGISMVRGNWASQGQCWRWLLDTKLLEVTQLDSDPKKAARDEGGGHNKRRLQAL
jgi:hypothetical protein